MTAMDRNEDVIYHVNNIEDIDKCPIETDINMQFLGDPNTALETDRDDDPRFITIPITRKKKMRICKPLILLKLALFIWYGAGSAVFAFIYVYFKQKGISVSEMASIYLVLPFVQFLGPTISGIIADKIGSGKPVLLVILLLNAILMVSIVLSPDMHVMNCDFQPENLQCHHNIISQIISKTNCGVSSNATELTSCTTTCPENVSQYCNGHNIMCDLLETYGNENYFPLFANISSSFELKDKCVINITSIAYRNATFSSCSGQHNWTCTISCLINAYDSCPTQKNGRSGMVFLNATLLILFLTVLSTTYRIMDVTAMALVEEHNSDFGRHRFFAMSGVFVFSVFSGYLVTASPTGQEDLNYKTGFYVFIGMIFVLIVVILKVKVQIKPPGKNMWKKAFYLLKKPDMICFVVVLLVLGSACGFNLTFLYWYLEGIGASSFQLGLINGMSALYGLPFLVVSNWCIRKLGTNYLLILGLLGYVAQSIAYSLLYNPWISLLIQVTDIVTYHLLWVAVVVHCHRIAPEGLVATIIAMAGGVHFNLGQGVGSYFGGLIMNGFGGKTVFRVIAGSCLTTAVLFATYNYLKRKIQSSKLFL